MLPLQDWQVLSPELLKNLQAAGVPVEVVQVVSGQSTLLVGDSWPVLTP